MSSASEFKLDPDALSAALLRHLAPQLTDALRAQVPAFVALLMALFNGRVPATETPPPALSALSNALAGAEIPVGGALISFGRDNHLGAVTIRDVVGRDQIHHTGNVFHIYGSVYLGGAAAEPATTALPPPATPPEVPRRTGINPFVTGTIKLPERFYGRRDELNDIRSSIGGVEPACVSVIGTKYSGKSSLLFFVRERINDLCAQEQKPVVVYVNLKSRLSRNVRGLVEILHQGIKEKTGFEFWGLAQSSEDWPFQSGLEQLYKSGYRLIVLLDEFDSISHRLNEFQGWGEDWHAKATDHLLTIIIASRRPLRELYDSCGLVSPFDNIFYETRLGALDPESWHQMVHEGFASQGHTVTNAELEFIDDTAGGIPYYTQLAAQIILRHQDPQQARAYFRNKAFPHFDSLWRDLSVEEQNALLYAVGSRNVSSPTTYVDLILKRQGLIRSNGNLFSSVFTDFVWAKNLR